MSVGDLGSSLRQSSSRFADGRLLTDSVGMLHRNPRPYGKHDIFNASHLLPLQRARFASRRDMFIVRQPVATRGGSAGPVRPGPECVTFRCRGSIGWRPCCPAGQFDGMDSEGRAARASAPEASPVSSRARQHGGTPAVVLTHERSTPAISQPATARSRRCRDESHCLHTAGSAPG